VASDDPSRVAPQADGVLVQLSSAHSSDAAAAEWRRIQKRLPDLLADRRPVMFQSENAGGALWGIRTAGFAGLKDAKDFCQEIAARGLSCYVVGSETNPSPGAARTTDSPANSPVAPTGGQSGGSTANGASASGSPTDGPVVQLSSGPTSDAAVAEWRRIQKHIPDLLADREPIMFQSDNPGGMRWGVRTAGFTDLAAAKSFCQSVSARGFSCYVIGS
jgi:cell division septation protein DedD